MPVKIQFRRDTATNWTSANPLLAAGEIGYETDTGNIKIGTGVAGSGAWNNLAYYQLPNVSVNPVTTANLNDAAYRVMGRYRLNSVTSGSTFTNAPSDLDTADADSYCAMIVTSHAYTALSTLIQQTLTQFSSSNTALKQWVRLYDGTNWTAWSSTAHLTDGEITTAKIADDAVTAAKLADDASTDGNRAVTTNHIRDSAVTTAKIADDAVTFAKIQNSAVAGLSVVGRSANSAGAFAEIAAGTDGHVLRRSGATVGFGTIVNAGIDASAGIALSKLANQVQDTIVGRASGAGTGVPVALTAAQARSVIDVASIPEHHDYTKVGAILMATKVGTGVAAPARGSIVGTGGTGVITYNAAGLNEHTISATGTHIGGGWTVCGSFICDDNRYGVLMIRTT